MTLLSVPSPIVLVLAALLSGCLAGCERAVESQAGDDAPSSVRIASLSPALTQALLEFECDSHLVGRTPFAPAGVEAVPVVGDLLSPDLERLLVVAPTVLLVQPASSGIDPDLLSLANARGWRLASWRIDRITDIDRIVDELPALLIEEGVSPEPMTGRVSAWRERSRELLVPVPAFERLGTVAVLFGVDPPSAFGQGTYVDDVMSALGIKNALQRAGYPELSLEDLLVLAPDTIVVLGQDEPSAQRSAETLAQRLQPLGARSTFVGVDGAKLLIPGTGVLDGAASLRGRLLRVLEAPAGGGS